jgi:hypothetical protein
LLRNRLVAGFNALLQPLNAEDAELLTLRGVFALETGDTARAKTHLRSALALARPLDQYQSYFPMIGAFSPLEEAASQVVGASLSSGQSLEFPSHGLAVYYLALLEDQQRKQ